MYVGPFGSVVFTFQHGVGLMCHNYFTMSFCIAILQLLFNVNKNMTIIIVTV